MNVTTARAASFAKISRIKFNEAVADGYYACAPETVAGSTREFDELDVIGVYVFARMLDIGMIPRRAGPLACEFREMLRQRPALDSVHVTITPAGARRIIDRPPGRGTYVFSMEFNIKTIKEAIAKAYAEIPA